jgi:Extensin-like protein C-terminus
VQAAACELFTTVLAPGSNVYHYDHIHVDLMRRASGRRICQPGAVSGDEVAARARGSYATSRGDSGPTGSILSHGAPRRATRPYAAYGEEDHRDLPYAVPGED